MERVVARLLVVLVLAVAAGGATLAVACDGDTDTEKAKQQVKDVGKDVQKETKEAWTTLRTDGERLVDRVQNTSDEGARRQLVNNCRDAQQRMANDADRAGRVSKLCDRIQNTDVNAKDAWNDIRREIQDLNREIGR